MKNIDKARVWLKRAKSSLAHGKVDNISSEILYEDLCFDCQQAVEKALKAHCIISEIAFPKTHDIAYLIELLEKENVVVPEEIQNSKLLTGYAVEARYPGAYEPVKKDDYLLAVSIAEKVIKWVEEKII